MSNIPIYQYTPLPALEVNVKMPFDDYEVYIKKEPELHGVKWVYESYHCASGLKTNIIVHKYETWSKYYQCHRSGLAKKRSHNEMESDVKKRSIQKESKKINYKAKLQISFDPTDSDNVTANN